MCACVMTMALTLSPCRFTMARISGMLSPGSITMASRVCSSPKIEQLHCSTPTRRISWIMTELYTRRYDRRAQRTHAVDAHHFGGYPGWRRALRAPGDRARDGVAAARSAGFARRRHGRPLPLAAISGDAAAHRHRHLQHGHEYGPRAALSIAAGDKAAAGAARVRRRAAYREAKKSETGAPDDRYCDLGRNHHRHLRRITPASRYHRHLRH